MIRSYSDYRSAKGQTGVTVLEVLIALGLLVVLLSFATPSLSGATARAELKGAAENMDLNIRMARNTARLLDTTVVMHLEKDRKIKHHAVRFSMPELPADSPNAETLIDYEFPESVRILSAADEIRFDHHGVLETPVQVKLVSLQDDEINHRILID